MKAIDIRWQHVLKDKRKNINTQLKDKDHGESNKSRHKQKDNPKDRVS
jgi:hypothetical protein